MSSEGLLPIEYIRSELPSSAPVGTLLLPYGESRGLLLRFDTDSAKLAFQLDVHHDRAFKGVNVEGRHHPGLVLEEWSLRVDPSSGYNAFENSPELGDVFVTKSAGGQSGFVGKLDHSTIYLSTDGKLMNEPDWGADHFIGFRRWSVGYQNGDRWINLLPTQDIEG
jgi:hypothetical protein